MALQNELTKPVFVLFVAAGHSTNFAVIFRKGASSFKMERLRSINREVSDSLNDYFERRCPISADTRMETSVGFIRNPPVGVDANDAVEHYTITCKKKTPGFGKHAENTSIAKLKIVAREFNLGFYRSELANATRLQRIMS